MVSQHAARGGAVAAGLLLDRLLGEPPSAVHPVAWFGTAMQRAEATLWADTRTAGFGYAVAGTSLGWAAGLAVRSTAAGVAIAVAGRALRSAGHHVREVLERGDIEAARQDLRALVGRDPRELDAPGIAAAVIESVAENCVDAVVAPAFWALLAGAPGVLAYRAVNTMDAMVGHRSTRYENFGWAAARLDDVANYVPARCFAALVALVEPTAARDIVRLVRRDAAAHPSPNAGVAETAVAAAIGVQLGGPLRYGEREERRPALGDGPRPSVSDIASAIGVIDRVERAMAAFVLAPAVVGLARRRVGRSGG